MNRYILIRRLKGPMILLLLGVVALLHHAGLTTHFVGLFVPLLLILLGVLLLAERATLAQMGDDPYAGTGYPGAYPGQYPGQYPGATPGVTPQAGTGAGPTAGASASAGEWKPPQGGQS
ncbi:MAG TPA: hypothetical protein VGR64_07320 [Terracidiphilus sp.]|nr:hypothetical protein [Terracidiphilus sp.]